MIEIKNLTKKYGATEVYSNFNLALEKGKITCILGESGSGKTTLLNCIAGLTEYCGEIPAVKCSYVFQSPRLVPNLTVKQNLTLVCADEEKVLTMLERVRLQDKKNAYPKTLSGGQAQRVAIARAFLYESEILLLDEPFSSLDLKLKNEMHGLFLQIWRQDKRTVLFVTHDADEAVSLADRLVVLKGGKAVFDAEPQFSASDELKNKEELRKKLISVLLES